MADQIQKTKERAESAIRFLLQMREERIDNPGVVDSIDNRVGPIRGYLRQMENRPERAEGAARVLNDLIDGEIREGYLSEFRE